jgi:hypothetical protein
MVRLTALALALTLGASKLNSVPLRFTPTDSVAAAVNQAARVFRGRKVEVEPFTDVREDKGLIGRNSEDDRPKDVTTREDVGGFCAARLHDLLRQAGVEVVAQGGDLVISGDVSRFMVEETDRYRGTVTLRLAVRDASGNELWSGQLSGDSDRFGRSYKYDNYMETLSDALLRLSAAFFGDAELGKAIR